MNTFVLLGNSKWPYIYIHTYIYLHQRWIPPKYDPKNGYIMYGNSMNPWFMPSQISGHVDPLYVRASVGIAENRSRPRWIGTIGTMADGRLPFSWLNPGFLRLVGNSPTL